MIPLLAALALGAARPLPDPADVRAGEAASQCVFYYRLQTTFAPGGSAACEAQGYGLEFMQAHWKEIAELEVRHQKELDAKLARGHRVAEALKHKPELEGPCFAMVLDGGPGPDGGAELCNLVGFTHDLVTRTARHRDYLREQAESARRRRIALWVAGVLGALALMAVLALVLRRR